MTKITAPKGKIHGIMVDGYIPNDNTLENLIYKLNDSESITNYEKNKLLRKIPFINNNSRFYLFYKLVYYATTRTYCPFVNEQVPFNTMLGLKKQNIPCLQSYYVIGNNRPSLINWTRSHLKGKKAKEIQSILKLEYTDIERQALDKQYIQNEIISGCGKLNECCNYWIKYLDFKIKRNSLFINSNTFSNICKIKLEHSIAQWLHYFDSR